MKARSDVKARSAVPKPKKRHVEVLTCPPTERLATACWAFIVVKRTWLQAAPVLVSRPLRNVYRRMLSTACPHIWLPIQPASDSIRNRRLQGAKAVRASGDSSWRPTQSSPTANRSKRSLTRRQVGGSGPTSRVVHQISATCNDPIVRSGTRTGQARRSNPGRARRPPSARLRP